MFPNPAFSEAEPIGAGMASSAISHGFSSHLDEARHYLGGMMALEVGSAGGVEPALRHIAKGAGVGFWTLHNLRRPNRVKSASEAIVARLRSAYLRMCAQQAAALQHQLHIAQEANRDVCFDDLAAEISALASRVADAQQSSLGERVHRGLRSRLDRRVGSGRLNPSSPAADARELLPRVTPTA